MKKEGVFVGKRLLLILNPISGMMTGKKHLADVIGKFCGADYEPTVFVRSRYVILAVTPDNNAVKLMLKRLI